MHLLLRGACESDVYFIVTGGSITVLINSISHFSAIICF